MAHRIRYFISSALTPKDLRRLSDSLCENEYSDKVAWGFIDIRNEGDAVTGTFVERFEAEDVVTDPFGEVIRYKRLQFSQAGFRLGLVAPHLEVYDAPRSITPLLTELSSSVDSTLAFSSVTINLQRLIKSFVRQTSSLSVVALTLEDITLSTDAFARVSVIGGSDVRTHINAASLGKKVKLERISLIGTTSSGAFKVEIASDARIQLTLGQKEEIVKLVRNSVTESIE